jgi:hypothetical protein
VTLHQCALRLAAPLGQRTLLGGSTGHAPGELTVWEFDERSRHERVLALDLDELEYVGAPPGILQRS